MVSESNFFPFSCLVIVKLLPHLQLYNSISDKAILFLFVSHAVSPVTFISCHLWLLQQSWPSPLQHLVYKVDCSVPEGRDDVQLKHVLFSSLTVSHASFRLFESVQRCLEVWGSPAFWAQGGHFHWITQVKRKVKVGVCHEETGCQHKLLTFVGI